MITQRPLSMVFSEIFESCKTKKQDRAAYVLFLAAICSNNSRRCSYIPENYRPRKGYESYHLTVSGPSFELIRILEDDNKEGAKLSASAFRNIAGSVTQKYLGTKDINKDILYQENHKVADYDRLLSKITSVDLKAVYKSLTKSISEKGLEKLIEDSYMDLTWRISGYTDNENVRKKKETRNAVSRFAYSLAPDKCEEAVKELNNKYNKATEMEKEKLENILLPVYSISPYFSICIAHKNMLPEKISKMADKNSNFVFVLSFAKFVVKENGNTKNHSRTQNIFSYKRLKSDLKTDIKIQRHVEQYGRNEEDQSLDLKYYTTESFGHDKCCATRYKDMRSKYESMLEEWEQCFIKSKDNCEWVPIDQDNKELKDLTDLLFDTGLFHEKNEKKKYTIPMRNISRRKELKIDENAKFLERLFFREDSSDYGKI